MNEIVQRISYEESCQRAAAERRSRFFGEGKSKNLIAEQKAKEREEAEIKRRRMERVEKLAQEAERRRALEQAVQMLAGMSISGKATAACSDETYVADLTKGDFVLGKPAKPTMTAIVNAVLERHEGISIKDVRSPGRKKKIVMARHEAIAAIRRIRPDLSLPAIGRFFNRDHTTILHAIRKFEGQDWKCKSAIA